MNEQFIALKKPKPWRLSYEEIKKFFYSLNQAPVLRSELNDPNPELNFPKIEMPKNIFEDY